MNLCPWVFVRMSRNQPDVLWRAVTERLVTEHSFDSWITLVWIVRPTRAAVSRDLTVSSTQAWPIYLALKWTLGRQSLFSPCFVYLLVIVVDILNIFLCFADNAINRMWLKIYFGSHVLFCLILHVFVFLLFILCCSALLYFGTLYFDVHLLRTYIYLSPLISC